MRLAIGGGGGGTFWRRLFVEGKRPGGRKEKKKVGEGLGLRLRVKKVY